MELIFSFIRRPKAVINHSQYIKEATELGKKARELKKAADELHQEERSDSKGRKCGKNMKAVEKLYSPQRPQVDVGEVFLWLMVVGTILCASYWSAWSAREATIEQDKLLKVMNKSQVASMDALKNLAGSS